ncbi:MAG TPA: hypothetical protein VFK05_19175 [Polyangiaceae bacterium]|nr:hypothetical protein [Polyangiaceae bacterium]
MSFEAFQEVDRRLADAAFHESSPFWVRAFERFYTSRARTLVARVGRGGAKSFHVSKFAVTELVFGQWYVPVGERHWFVVVSLRQDEGLQRVTQIDSMLRALGVSTRRSDNKLELVDAPLGVIVLPCSIGAVSGYRCIGAALDEAAKWRSADSSANPAKEVRASITAMRITHPHSRELIVSSAFGVLDHHHELIERGDAEDQIVEVATSWQANPSITEAETRRIEPDERVWLREYASIPQAEASSAYPPEKVAQAFRPFPTEQALTPAVAFGVDDPSSGRRDSWTSAVCRMYYRESLPEFVSEVRYTWVTCKRGLQPYWEPLLTANGQPVPNPDYRGPAVPLLVVEHIEANEGVFWRGLPASELVRQRAAMYRSRGVGTVFGDQREAYLLQSAYAQHGVRYIPLAWTAENKPRAVERVRRWLAEEIILLPDHHELKRQLLAYQERITPSGAITFDGRTGDDFAALLVTLALAELEGLIPASPLQRRSRIDGEQLRRAFSGESLE